MKKSGIILMALGLFSLSACATTKGTDLTACDCYTIYPPVTEESFVLDDNKTIVPVELGCKDGFFITKMRLQPQPDPEQFSQYIIVREVTCCRVCQDEQ